MRPQNVYEKMSRVRQNLKILSSNENEKCGWPTFKSPEEHSVTKESHLNKFLQGILNSHAKYPDSVEARQNFQELDKMVVNICSTLHDKYVLFHGCTAKRV